jgi:hypothetical protein
MDGVAPAAAGVATATNLINLGVPALRTLGRDVSWRGHPGSLPSFLLLVPAIVLGKYVSPPFAGKVRPAPMAVVGRGSVQRIARPINKGGHL